MTDGAVMLELADPIDLDTLRLRSEFLEMPGLTLTVAQAARLVGVRASRATEILNLLAEEGFLVRNGLGAYHRRSSV